MDRSASNESLARMLDEAMDSDPQETAEWTEALTAAFEHEGGARARFLLERLEEHAQTLGLSPKAQPFSAYRNTIALEHQPPYPGDIAIEERLTAIMRWNALAMVVRANQAHGELGGHIASYASAAEIFELGFNHFFRADDGQRRGDLVFMQPHSAPGIYARAWLEGRLTEDQLALYRQELAGSGLSSYPHPWLMPEFWQFPTGSMGLGPLCAIYQARFLRYLEGRGLLKPEGRRVWGIFGDGEMDEPESIAGLTLAARENLDHLTFVINCNLQRLDGPVRGNGQIIQELESLFKGAGWNVIKVLWGSDWDGLFARDHEHVLLRALASTVDGQYQTLGAKDGAYNIEHFFRQNPAVQALVAHMSEAEIDALRRGGHDFRKLYAAFSAATQHTGRPTVILAKTKKGFGMGGAGESRMTAHQAKKLDLEALKVFRDRFALPLTDDQISQLSFYRPPADSPEMRYLHERRARLGGFLPARVAQSSPLAVPVAERWGGFAIDAADKDMSTTMAAVRMLANLMKEPEFGPRVVPIVADEARTFGMASLFRQYGIYSPQGQRYEPEDAGSIAAYREARDGQLLEEGITEAGAMASWIAAATSYSVHGLPMLPVYIYYSMFGFQRVGDLIWAAGDQRARGILFGATAGRTTLGGEGLQHQDGSSLVMASMVPNCRAWEPAFAGELAVIVEHAMKRMLESQHDEFHYITLMNESYPMPSLPPGQQADLLSGLYRFATHTAPGETARVRLLGSGAILREVIAAAELLRDDWGIGSDVFSVTSYSELARNAAQCQRLARLGHSDELNTAERPGLSSEVRTAEHPGLPSEVRTAEHPGLPSEISTIERLLAGRTPVVAASDQVRAWPQMIAEYVPARFITLGTDGFGRSDTRERLRRFFEVDRHSIALAAIQALVMEGMIEDGLIAAARLRYRTPRTQEAPWER